MINVVLSALAPHHCFECQKIGSLLCDNCKYNITQEPFSQCIVCLVPASHGVCQNCQSKLPYTAAWCIQFREGALAQLLDGYKFSYIKSAGSVFGDLLHTILPANLPVDTVVVPVPTVSSHVRQRGYDHALMIAKRLAKHRRLPCRPLLRRLTQDRQRGATRAERRKQAARAFGCTTPLSSTTTYLLVDDVFTTGATIEFAAKALYKAGARQIVVAVALRQPLDE